MLTDFADHTNTQKQSFHNTVHDANDTD